MTAHNEIKSVITQYGIAATMAILAGFSAALWCVGLAAFIAMLVIIFRPK